MQENFPALYWVSPVGRVKKLYLQTDSNHHQLSQWIHYHDRIYNAHQVLYTLLDISHHTETFYQTTYHD